MPCPGRKSRRLIIRREGNLTSIVPMLIASHDKRISHDKDFRYLQEDIAEFNKLRRTNLISLNEADRRKEREAHGSTRKVPR